MQQARIKDDRRKKESSAKQAGSWYNEQRRLFTNLIKKCFCRGELVIYYIKGYEEYN